MRITATTRLLLESGIIVSLLAGASWFAVIAYKVDAQAEQINEISVEQKVLSRDLVDTQKKIIEDITAIKTRMGIKEK